ncbi:MAG: hypothetical protein RL065_2109 [Bacteroidota bacterium]|jgi:hypothetical protein
MKYIATFILLFSLSNISIAQSDSTWKFKRKNNINFELLGSGVLYSINYERLVYQSKYFKSNVATGFSYAPYRFFSNQSDIQFLVNYNQFISFSKNNHADIGIGIKLINDFKQSNPEIITQPIFHVGFRHQKLNRRFFYKILIAGTITKMELMILPSEPFYQPSFFPCIGLGYAF